MKKVKLTFRLIFFLTTVLLLFSLNRTTDSNNQTIASFKLKTIEKLRTDSLDAKHKLDVLLNETTKFLDSSSRVRKEIDYLMALMGFWCAVEFGFLILGRKYYRRQEIE